MPELRWNPLLDTWTMVATNRQHRPHLPNDWCPFCPGEGKLLPKEYDVFAYPNDFAALSLDALEVEESNNIFRKKAAYGRCEVILYSPDHNKRLYELSEAHLLKLVNLWKERFEVLSKDEKIKYIFEFENRGAEVGVTMPHPHGQLYAYSWLPSKILTELENCKKYFETHQRNLFDDLNEAERSHQTRVLLENESFISYIPYFTDYPFGVFIVHKKQVQNFSDFSEKDKMDLIEMLKKITAGFDKIYERLFPYMMCIHQSPVNCEEYTDTSNYFRFHIEFYPPLRSKDKVKWYAGSEMGAGAAANPLDVDECAQTLKKCIN